MIRSICIVLFSVMFSMAANAAQSGNWSIQYFPDDTDKSGCIMSTDYRSGTRLSLIVNKGYSWGLGFYNPKWNLKKGGTTDVAAYIDGRLVATAKAEHISETVAVLPLERSDTYRALQLGRLLMLKTPRGDLGFALDGTARAMDMVLDCVKSLPSQAASTTTPNQNSASYQLVTEAEAAVILSNLLNSASVANFRIQPPNGRLGVADFQLADGSYGFLVAGRGSPPSGADDAASTVLKVEAENCTGDFKSGKQVLQSTDGSIVRKVVTSCQKGSSMTVSDATIVRKSDGFLLTLSHVYPEGVNTLKEAPQAEKGGQGVLTEAAMKYETAR